MYARGDASNRHILSEIARPDDPRLVAFAWLLERTFSDPNSVLDLERIQQFLAQNAPGSARRFCVLVAEDHDQRLVGGSVFSYLPESNCGFSEYLLLEPESRGLGLGHALFDRRKMILDAHAGGSCRGLFIEVDNPERAPPDTSEASLDPHERLSIFGHLGFKRVDVAYVQPPLGPGKEAVDFMDLLFTSWDVPPVDMLPVEWIVAALTPIWSAWTPETASVYLEEFRQRVGTSRSVLLQPLRNTRTLSPSEGK
jgi:hypothetical protein